MAKNILITVDDATHDAWRDRKGDRTWREVLEDGL